MDGSPVLRLNFRIVIPLAGFNFLPFREATINHPNCCWQTSKRFSGAAHFLSISNTQMDGDVDGRGIRKCIYVCAFTVRVCVGGWVFVFVCVCLQRCLI